MESKLAEDNLKLKIAESLIDEANETLSSLMKDKVKLDKSSVTKAQIVLNAGIERAKEIKETIDEIKDKIKTLSK